MHARTVVSMHANQGVTHRLKKMVFIAKYPPWLEEPFCLYFFFHPTKRRTLLKKFHPESFGEPKKKKQDPFLL